jgi:hypothetical protein
MGELVSTLKELEATAPEFMDEFSTDASAIFDRVGEKTKEAGAEKFFSKETAQNIGKTIATTGAVTIALGVGTAIGTDLYNAARRGLTSGRNWKRMMSSNPDLHEQDVADVRRAFKTVQKYAPDIAADPMTSGSLVYRMMHAAPGDHDKMLRDTITLQKDYMNTKYEPFKSVPKVDLSDKRDFSDKRNMGDYRTQINRVDKVIHGGGRKP